MIHRRRTLSPAAALLPCSPGVGITQPLSQVLGQGRDVELEGESGVRIGPILIDTSSP